MSDDRLAARAVVKVNIDAASPRGHELRKASVVALNAYPTLAGFGRLDKRREDVVWTQSCLVMQMCSPRGVEPKGEADLARSGQTHNAISGSPPPEEVDLISRYSS